MNTQPAVAVPVLPPVGPDSTRLICPYCHATVNTTVTTSPSTKTHLMALVICLLCFPCVCVPYCVDSCQAKKHTCPSCNAYLGTYDN